VVENQVNGSPTEGRNGHRKASKSTLKGRRRGEKERRSAVSTKQKAPRNSGLWRLDV